MNSLININEKRIRLFTPGPLNTSKAVRFAASKDIGSRTIKTELLTEQICNQLVNISKVGNQCAVALIQGSGTFAVEATLSTLLNNEDHLIILSNGIYARRIEEIAIIHRIQYTVLKFDEKSSIPINDILDRSIKAVKGATHIVAVHFETGLGVLNDIEALTSIAKKNGLRLIIDAISTFGALDIPWVNDCTTAIIASSNKCLHGIPGVGIIIYDNKQLDRAQSLKTLSLDLKAQVHSIKNTKQWRFTPPTHVLLALHQALYEHENEGGITSRGKKYNELSNVLIEGLSKLSIEPVIEKKYRGSMITTFKFTQKIDIEELTSKLEEQGFVIYPSKLDELNSFRVGCMGEIFKEDIILLIENIKIILNK